MLLVARVDAVLHGLDGGKHAHERGAQLVGHVVGEAAFELAVVLNLLGHLIERLAELAEVVLAPDAAAGRQLAFLDAGGRVGNGAHGSREHAGDDESQNDGKQNGDKASHADGLERAGAEGLVTLGEQVLRAVHPYRHGADLLAGAPVHVDAHHLRGGWRQRHVSRIGVGGLTGSGKRGIVHGRLLGVADLHADVLERLGT